MYDPYLYSGKFNTASRRQAGVVVSGNSAYVSESSFEELLESDDEHPPKSVLNPITRANAIADNFFIILPPMNILNFKNYCLKE